MDISAFISNVQTEQQRQLYERITREEKEYPNCIAAILGYLDIEKQDTLFDPRKAFPFIENILETTEAPEFGALAVWDSNPIALMTANSKYITPVRHAALVLGTRFGSLYVFDQMRGSLHADPIQETTRRVDEFSKERYGERYTGIVTVRYHPLEAVDPKKYVSQGL